ncbi:sensor histidine kinase [Parvularcula lutaonensis]|uniref:histidine kinase n=1 Tax=Parvularcula lutaonensis TaxID=491923 RepID=A0ABV7M8T1_9PROT|nr:PAS domain-containing protein [Parvularcula lutaonensis]GGY56589.1 hypothetical protein GCM10007148_27720 [Parvularcula lutaonensis]
MQARAKQNHLEQEVDGLLHQPGAARFLDDVAVDGVLYWDLEKPDQQWVSPGFWERLGYESGLDLNDGASWQRLVFAEDHARLLENFRQHCLDPDTPFDQTIRVRKADGHVVTVRCRGTALREGGTPVRMLGVQTILDETQAPRIDRQLSELIEMSDDAVMAWSFKKGVCRWNAGAEKLFGVSAAQAEGRDPGILTEAIYPEPWQEISRKLSSGEQWSGEVQRRAADGRRICTSARLSPVDIAGGDILVLEIDRDITAEREVREKLRDHNRELNHRVKNLFAIIQGLIDLSGTDASDPILLTRKIQARISALAAAHLVSIDEEEVQSISFMALLEAVLRPYDEHKERLSLVGDQVRLPKRAVTPAGMIFHELATNAVKYGAWSRPGGSIAVAWEEIAGPGGQPRLSVSWRENFGETAGDGGIDVEGLGVRLIRQSARQLGGTAAWEWQSEGLMVTLEFPIGDER